MTQAMLEIRSFQPAAPAPSPLRDWDAVAPSALVHRVRWHTGLSQSAFAEAYGLDLGHLRALERGEARPDDAMTAYLTVIDRAPDAVRAALTAG